jgi:hypothetical protein
MTQADRVLSTPPTNTSARHSRRSILGAIAGSAAAAGSVAALALPTTAAASADPIYAAIEAFRRADAACVAVHGDIPDDVGDRWSEAISAVLRTRPATPAGLAALTTWARERADWLCANGTEAADDFCTVSATIDDAARGMSGLEPWSPPPLAAMAVSADPAFALIAEKLAADVAHGEAIDAQDEAEDGHGIGSDGAEEAFQCCSVACSVVNEADWRLATTPPTTLAGVAAVLRFANEIEDGGMEWPATDTVGPEGWHYQLRATMAAAIEALIKAQAGKAVA